MIDSTFLRTKVARRVFGLFLLSALVPTGVLAIVAYRQVTRQLTEQSAERLRLTSKLHGQAVQERLAFAAEDLRHAAIDAGHVSEADRDSALTSLARDHPRFARFAVAAYVGPSAADTNAARWEHLRAGRPVLTTHATGEGSQVLLGLALHPSNPGGEILWAELRPDYLWASAANRIGTADVSVCVVRDGERLYCEVPIPESRLESLATTVTSSREARFTWWDEARGGEYIAAHWEVFLRAEYSESGWLVIATTSRSAALAPASRFRVTFILGIGLSLAIVFVLSNVQVRRSLEPLRQLRRGTRHITEGDLEVQIPVSTDDEFGELATSFNAMAHRLFLQFSALGTRNEIDRAILSSLDAAGIANTVLSAAAGIAQADTATLSLLLDESGSARCLTRAGGEGDSRFTVERELTIPPHAIEELRRHPTDIWVDGDLDGLGCLEATQSGMAGHLVLPVRVDGDLGGWLALGYASPSDCGPDNRVHARQLADQAAVGLTNARLVEDLDELNWATIQALARTIDAKSQWTAGHSERVTCLAVALGEALGIDEEELDVIRRGGLLHDIGKIGVPAAILDKPSRLTDEEFEVVRQHPLIGARILEPVQALASVIGIVRHHHERIDGDGYPDGLAGDDIPYLARIMSVADVWDSLRSERPYRAALSLERTEQILLGGSGTQFDSEMVEVFMRNVAPTDVAIVDAGGAAPAEAGAPQEERHVV